MEVTESLHSWLFQHGLAKYPLQAQKNHTFLHEEDAKRLESGHRVLQLLKKITNVDTVSLKDGNSSSVRSSNWGVIGRSLEKAGIQVSSSTRASIVGGNLQAIVEILLKLKQFDASSWQKPKDGALVLDEINSCLLYTSDAADE